MWLDDKARVNAQNNDGWTPLRVAAIHENSDTVRTLLDNGADASADYQGKTALSVAIEYGHQAVATLLQDAGAHR